MKAPVGPEPIPAMAHMPTIATAYSVRSPVSINGITTSAQGTHPAQPSNIIRRRPNRSHSVADSATNVMLTSPPSAPMAQMKLRE